ncbi:MAG: MBL fold metallo-hydrolase [Planctomycetes bacterium]|nr:MBL fold metallo-hydrolase [Planctomycetota bacterium]
MRLQVLSSGSEGNSTLIRAGEQAALVDAGLGREAMLARLEAGRLGPGAVRHVLVTHGHLDHARSAGLVARRERATLHAADLSLHHPWARRAKSCAALAIGRDQALPGAPSGDELVYRAVPLPHDCDPTVAFRLEHQGRVAVILTDVGRPDPDVARALSGAHVLVLEFNYDPGLLARGPYPALLQRRIAGGRGHLSNAEGARLLELLASAELHTVIVAHVSKKTNRPELARAAAAGTLERLGLAGRVRLLVASQDEALESVEV